MTVLGAGAALVRLVRLQRRQRARRERPGRERLRRHQHRRGDGARSTWMTVELARHGQPSVLGAAAGAVAGLVGDHPGRRAT